MYKRKPLIVGFSFTYENGESKIITNAQGVGAHVTISSVKELEAFAKALADAWKDHLGFSGVKEQKN